MVSLEIDVLKTATISDFFMMEISETKRATSNYETPLNYENYALKHEALIAAKINQINS